MNKKRFWKIYIEITNVCNLRCRFCPEIKREKEFITIAKFEKIVKQIKDYTDLIALHVKGEPLLHPKLKEILLICEQNKIAVNITTNATLLSKNLNTIIKSKAVRQLNLSIHSVYENSNISLPNYMDEILKSIRVIKEKTDIYVSYRLWNIESLLKNQKNKEIFDILKDEYKIENLLELAKKDKFVQLDNKIYLNQDFEFVWPNINGKIISETGTCYGARNQIAILVNGDVVPCCLDQEGDILLGNIFEKNIEEILNNDRTRKIIKGFEENKLLESLCQKCGFRDRKIVVE